MDIIYLRHDVLGKTVYGKTLCTFFGFRFMEKRCARFWFSFLLVLKGPPYLGRKGSRSTTGRGIKI